MENQTEKTASNPSPKNSLYPEIIIPNNTKPNKLYAFPVIGYLIKFIMLIPVLIVSALVGFIYGVLWMLTPFVILFTGKYWETSYKFTISYFIYTAKIQFFLMGITDKYPGFSLETDGVFEFHLPKPNAPSRFLAFPFLGFFVRAILLIPYYIFQVILQYAMYIATAASWFGVWITGKYPESLYEFNKDVVRINLAYLSYFSYLSDSYPSFHISLNHKKIKILLIILGIALAIADFAININDDMNSYQHAAATYNSASSQNSPGSDQ